MTNHDTLAAWPGEMYARPASAEDSRNDPIDAAPHETQLARLRAALLADPDLGLDTVSATGIALVLAPVVVEMLEEDRAMAPARGFRPRPRITPW